jgi:hypothetical protein
MYDPPHYNVRDDEKSGKYLTVLRAGLIFSQQKGAERILARCMDRSNLPSDAAQSLQASLTNLAAFRTCRSVYCKFSSIARGAHNLRSSDSKDQLLFFGKNLLF